MGIGAEDVPKLFTRFFRVDSSLTRQIGGTGLGLSIVKSIVEMQGGRVEVGTAPGRGLHLQLQPLRGGAGGGSPAACRTRRPRAGCGHALTAPVEANPDERASVLAGFRGVHDAAARIDAFAAHLCTVEGLQPETATAAVEVVTSLEDPRPPAPNGLAARRPAELTLSAAVPVRSLCRFPAGRVSRRACGIADGLGQDDDRHAVHSGLAAYPAARPIHSRAGPDQRLPAAMDRRALLPARRSTTLPGTCLFGTPGKLERPCAGPRSSAVILTAYAALGQTGCGLGKGAFDVDSIERFCSCQISSTSSWTSSAGWSGCRSMSSDVMRLLVAWLSDASLRGLIGTSGTAEAYGPRFPGLGPGLAHAIPLDALIGLVSSRPLPSWGAIRERGPGAEDPGGCSTATRAGGCSLKLVGGERFHGLVHECHWKSASRSPRPVGMFRGGPTRAGQWPASHRLGEGRRDQGSQVELVSIIQMARGWSDAAWRSSRVGAELPRAWGRARPP